MLRRLHAVQPETFAFTPANRTWAEAQMTKFPEGRQASAVIPLLWRAQEQEGWLSRPAIEEVARMLDMAYIRVLEVATFYFMFQLQPVGSVAHLQICGTTSCMICGAEDLVAVCRDRIARQPHHLSADGKFSWEEVECLGACANAPMAQIGKDYYEDLTAGRLRVLIDEMAAGQVPTPGPQQGRFAAEPAGGLTSLTGITERQPRNGSVALAHARGDTLKRIDGSEGPVLTPWLGKGHEGAAQDSARDDLMPPEGVAQGPTPGPKPAEGLAMDETGITVQESTATEAGRPAVGDPAPEPAGAGSPASLAGAEIGADQAVRPAALEAPRAGQPDDLKMIKGIGPKLESLLQSLGFYHFDQIARWSPAELAWVDRNLEGFRGRAIRDDWVAQAKLLATGQET